ncbi:hypothetical protein [Rhizobium sp. L1K21]|uniref:hypothetical protein n=1 Tax=Rhizobium sp. L1K21 TaxID=2954933 RepID=UPI002092104A|nr:hypothetical protein [Rhizobium sp. L1K21]MCO6188243.1 hypothetical protein [Rhizobium sp. L1K21]
MQIAPLCLRRLHLDQRGMEVATIIILMAVVGIPLIIALTGFGSDILDLLKDSTDRLRPNE